MKLPKEETPVVEKPKKVFRAPPGNPAHRKEWTEEEAASKSYIVVPQEVEERPLVVTAEGYVVKQPRPFKNPPGRPRQGAQLAPTGEEIVRKEMAKSSELAKVIEREEGFADASHSQRLRLTGDVLLKQAQHAALIVATESIEDLTLDPVLSEWRRLKVKYINDVLQIRKQMLAAAKEVEEEEAFAAINVGLDTDTLKLIEEANKTLGLGDDDDGDE